MRILIEGSEEQIEIAKSVLKPTCFFNSKFCSSYEKCAECEKEQNLKIEYAIKNS